MARTRRVVPVSEKIEAKKAEIAKVEEKLAKLQNELKELQTKADAEKKCSATRGVRKRCPYEKTVSTCDKHKCELPSRVTLADFQTTKKLANPHKY